MAVDPELVKAFTKLAWILFPVLVFGAVVDAMTGGSKRRTRPRRSSGQTPFEILLDGILSLLVLPFTLFTRNKRFKEQNTLEQLRKLSPRQFEDYIANLFQHLGFRTEVVGGSYDGGIDIIATRNGEKYYIQCKKFITSQVPVGAVRDFYGAIVDRQVYTKAFFITTNVFTLEAEKFCEDKPIELIDGPKLMEYIRQAGVEVPESQEENLCPKCGGILKLRNGKFGPFIGCSNFPKCHYTKPT